MWGTLFQLYEVCKKNRFIPTHVGNTPRRWSRSGLPSVHPHACGEHHTGFQPGRQTVGSSPRMWGTLLLDLADLGRERFIPTHVGNTWWTARRRSSGPVHPHACGEHLYAPAAEVWQTGSSPRMWGTQHRGPVCFFLNRFIPTHVGNTSSSPTLPPAGSVHPHACGEHHLVGVRFTREHGSSPRMWGTLLVAWLEAEIARFIPTHVGNTARLRRRP